MQARDVMTREVVSARPDTPVAEVARLMMARGISGVPIVDDGGTLLGLVSEGDLLRRVEPERSGGRSWWLRLFAGENAEDFVKTEGRHARDVMTKEVVTATPDTHLGEIARLLESRRIKRVPVVEGGRLVGIVSRANLLHAVAANPAPAPETAVQDRDLRDAVTKALEDAPGVSAMQMNVVVAGGTVDIWGYVHTDAERDAARVAAENVPGVRHVQLHLGTVPAAGYWV
ncbi:CBS domain-containing protein [Tranquillimonas alkanivorans]|uniref:BON domain-containing protein n=1 Tax=Tranquillimonas alkanivorans TaxID=441119 RepID=A0A1I5UU26_9RHOB|nr:CBS domain-containing protein [Tranquillimonas alkanivorans]SFP98547.1 BON domain-containing protein [Tranquillimonas alkanivorans]